MFTIFEFAIFLIDKCGLINYYFTIGFCWVRREANNVVHCLAKFVSLRNLSFCCNNSSLTLSVLEA